MVRAPSENQLPLATQMMHAVARPDDTMKIKRPPAEKPELVAAEAPHS